MTPPKKWMALLTEDQYNWIKSIAEKTEVSGGAVIRALIAQAMEQNSADFRRGLMSTQLKAELQALEVAKAKLEAKEKEIRMKMNGKEKVAV